MRTIKLTLSYDGTNYCGWQTQANARSVQQVLETAVREMTHENVAIVGSGRTDAGVHALAQIAHFKTESNIPCHGFRDGINSLLPDDICVCEVSEVDPKFDARRSAKLKHYRYRILVSAVREPLMLNRFWVLNRMPNLREMKRAAKFIKGKHDFACFEAAGSEVANTARCVSKIKISKHATCDFFAAGKGVVIDFEFFGSGFLRHMVRNIVGTLVDVGFGKLEAGDIKLIIELRDRKRAGVCAPAHGLYLVEVFY